MRDRSRWTWRVAAAALALPPAAGAEVRSPAVVGPHMVLQRDMPARVWGWPMLTAPRAPARGRAPGGLLPRP
jgi:hypothetical protein